MVGHLEPTGGGQLSICYRDDMGPDIIVVVTLSFQARLLLIYCSSAARLCSSTARLLLVYCSSTARLFVSATTSASSSTS